MTLAVTFSQFQLVTNPDDTSFIVGYMTVNGVQKEIRLPYANVQAITNAVTQANNAATLATNKAAAADTSASAASTSATNAATSATASASSASAAAGSEAGAATSASAAANDRAAADTAAANALAAAAYKTNRPAVRLATAAALPTNTYAGGVITMSATGVLTVDGVAVALNDALVVKDETDQTKNGVYTCTTAGASGVAAVLTRRSTENTGATLAAACVQVTAGTVNTGWTFLCQQSSITLGTTSVSFAGQAGAVGAEAATRLSVDNGLGGNQAYVMLAIASVLKRIDNVEAQQSAAAWASAGRDALLNALQLQISSLKPDYYVSGIYPTASDSNNGTSWSTPFRSLAPLLALSANALDGKVIAIERGGSYTPADLGTFTVNGATFTAYGLSNNLPYFDCTAAVPASWSLYAAGVYSVGVTRNTFDSKSYGNVFRNGVPMRKVESIAALSGKGDYVCFVQNELSTAPTIYMNASADPNSDGAAYRYSKFAKAITTAGTGNTIDSLWGMGCGHQDGIFVAGYASGSLGGNRISRCRMDWGGRHSALVGSGVLPSSCDFNQFNGAADEIETGGVLNAAGTANAVVFNSLDHSAATCLSRYNTYHGMGRPNYIAGTRNNFTGPYGHDGTLGNPMLRFEVLGDTYYDMQQGPGICGQTNLFQDPAFFDTIDMIGITTNNAQTEIKGIRAGSDADRFLYNSSYTTTINYHDNGRVEIPDAGAGGAGWVRCGEGTAVTNLTLTNSVFNLKGCRNANGNKRFIRIRSGSLTMSGCTVGPNIAPPVDLLIEAGIGGQTCTLALTNNRWPYGSNFSHAGTTYRGLGNWMAAGKETGSSYNALPWAQYTDSFAGADANLGDTPGWTRLNGAAADLQRKAGVLYGNMSSGTPTVFTRGDLSSADMYVRYINKGTASAGGAGLRVVNASNLLFTRVSATAIDLMRVTAGAVASATSTGTNITPSAGQEHVVVVRDVTDPNTGVTSQRGWLMVDGGLYSAPLVDLSAATGLTGETTVGAVARGAVGDLLDDIQFGAAPMTLQ